jgi:hypothetical protein
MHLFENQTFHGFRDFESSTTFSDLSFKKCIFESCSLSAGRRPQTRSTVRNVRIEQCRSYGCHVGAAIVEDTTIDGLTTGDILQTGGAVFKHVVLSGKIGRLMISREFFTTPGGAEQERAFDLANAEYYRHVDWALDISQGGFSELDIRSVPGHLVRRNPETQARIKRERLVEVDWRKLPFNAGVTQIIFDLFLKRGDPDVTYVAGQRAKHFREMVADIELLRKEGIAEPN